MSHEWERFRSLEYLIFSALSSEKVSLYEYKPLPTDPSPEEIAEFKNAAAKQRVDAWKQRIENAKKRMPKNG